MSGRGIRHLLRGNDPIPLRLPLLLTILLRPAPLFDVLPLHVPLLPAPPRPVPLLDVLHCPEHQGDGPYATADMPLLLVLIPPAPLWL